MHFVFFQLLSFTLNKQFLYSRMYFNTLLKEDTFVSSCCWHSCVLVTCADRFWYNGIFLINTSDLSSFLCSFNVHSFLFVCLFVSFFQTGFLCVWSSFCGPGCPGIHRDPPASASWVLGLRACATTAQPMSTFLKLFFSHRLWSRALHALSKCCITEQHGQLLILCSR